MDQDIADRPAGQRVAVHQLGSRQLTAGLGLAQRGRGLLQTPDAAQQLVGERQRGHRAAGLLAGGHITEDIGQAEAGEVLAGDDDHAGEGVEGLGLVLGETPLAGTCSQVSERRGLIVAPEQVIDAEQPAAGQPSIGGPDRPQHDQHPQPGGDPVAPPRGEAGRSPPLPACVGAAQQPAFLPGIARETLQPVQHGGHRLVPPPPLPRGHLGEQALGKAHQFGPRDVLTPGRKHRQGLPGQRPGQESRITRADRSAAEAAMPGPHQLGPNTSARSAGS